MVSSQVPVIVLAENYIACPVLKITQNCNALNAIVSGIFIQGVWPDRISYTAVSDVAGYV